MAGFSLAGAMQGLGAGLTDVGRRADETNAFKERAEFQAMLNERAAEAQRQFTKGENQLNRDLDLKKLDISEKGATSRNDASIAGARANAELSSATQLSTTAMTNQTSRDNTRDNNATSLRTAQISAGAGAELRAAQVRQINSVLDQATMVRGLQEALVDAERRKDTDQAKQLRSQIEGYGVVPGKNSEYINAGIKLLEESTKLRNAGKEAEADDAYQRGIGQLEKGGAKGLSQSAAIAAADGKGAPGGAAKPGAGPAVTVTNPEARLPSDDVRDRNAAMPGYKGILAEQFRSDAGVLPPRELVRKYADVAREGLLAPAMVQRFNEAYAEAKKQRDAAR
jgi:hypothetical protein